MYHYILHSLWTTSTKKREIHNIVTNISSMYVSVYSSSCICKVINWIFFSKTIKLFMLFNVIHVKLNQILILFEFDHLGKTLSGLNGNKHLCWLFSDGIAIENLIYNFFTGIRRLYSLVNDLMGWLSHRRLLIISISLIAASENNAQRKKIKIRYDQTMLSMKCVC